MRYDPNDRVLPITEVSRLTALGKTAIYTLMGKGEFPRHIRLTSHRVGWLKSEVDK
jgi:predicted DNA-binding transcriptional regulator AlpA